MGALGQLASIGSNGQTIRGDPLAKLVPVQTAVEAHPAPWRVWATVVDRFGR